MNNIKPSDPKANFPNYNSPQELRAFLESRGLGMRKRFGQNFMINPDARARLLDALELPPGEGVWEIGPGIGAMTAGLLERGARVTAFEIDSAFAGILRELFADNPAFSLVEGDVLKTWPAFRPDKSQAGGAGGSEDDSVESSAVSVVADDSFLFGNLPYNIAAALLADFIEKGRFFLRAVVTVQREVALRVCAAPGSADYSSFTVLCSSVYKAKPLAVIKAASFFPAPRVDSQGVRLDIKPEVLSGRQKLPALFYPLVRSLFSARRKKLRNTLSAYAAQVIMKQRAVHGASPAETVRPAEAAAEVLRRAGISGDRRAETLDMEEFAALASFLEDRLA